ncbi:baseplate J/gp47 family protein [bacterium]|nr:baseplate J/gp47 family protein [bacterium]
MPKKKIYDIKPPQEKEEIVSFHIPQKKPLVRRKFFWYSLGTVILILLLLWFFLPASSATIYIFPKTNEIKTDAFVVASENLDKPDMEDQKIPLYSFEKELTISKVYQSSLKDVSEKARGVIRVFNEYSTRVILVAGTRFLSATEPSRIFYSTKKIIIPAGGYVDVEVVASEAGEEYNIEPTTFSVPGLRNYSPPQLYYSVYAKSFKKMSGGATKKESQVTQEDLDKAKEDLLKTAESKSLEELRSLAGDDYLILKKTLETEVISAQPFDVVAGQKAENFTYQIKIKAKAKGVKKEDLDLFARYFIDAQIPPDKEVSESTIKTKINQVNIDLDKNVTLEVEIYGKILSAIDKALIREIAKSQTRNQIIKHLNELYPNTAKKPEVKFHPFFTRKSPRSSEKINLEIKI